MPFIITTRRPLAQPLAETLPAGSLLEGSGTDIAVVSRVAVATLQEARTEVTRLALVDGEALLADNYAGLRQQFAAVREAGGTVGPLPDGTLIEVEPIGLRDLFVQAVDLHGLVVRAIEATADSGMVSVSWPARESVIIAAFNAREVADAA